jgi:uroporphyrinogen III methyltransferase/synthase
MTPAETVIFVGAGPGAADLLTLRAVDRLRRAEVVVHDRLVHAEVLALLPESAERICIDRGDLTDHDPGRATGELLVRLAAAGRQVVRLKGGDPTIFARLAEELEPLRQAGLAVEIVPGVTAALAAGAAAGVPLTSREVASSLSLVTGHEARGKVEPCDLTALAQVPGTIAVYMGVEQIASWSRRLMEAGRDGGTPVTIVSRCSWPDQHVATTTLAECASDAEREAWRSPAVLLVGEAVVPAARGPLEGRLVIVTRPVGQEGEMASLVQAAGGACLPVPVLRITSPTDLAPLDAAIATIDRYDWIVFASTNGVRGFLDRLRAAGRDGRALGTARLAAIGPSTRRCLEEAGYVCDLMPDAFCSEGLVDAFADRARGGRFLLVRADRGRDLLRRSLEAAGQVVDEVAAYQSVAVEHLDVATEEMLAAARSPWITVTSGGIAEAAIRLFGPWIRGWQIASLSPVTSATLRRFGLEPTVEAREATAAGLVASIVAHEGGRPPAPAQSTQSVGSPSPATG